MDLATLCSASESGSGDNSVLVGGIIGAVSAIAALVYTTIVLIIFNYGIRSGQTPNLYREQCSL